MKEIWKDVVGYEGLYLVSDSGRIRGVKSGKVLKPGSTGKYLFVVLCKDGKRTPISVHRVVATAFCDNPYLKSEVNHINEDRYDNRAVNLEWCTRLENIRHGTGIEKHAKSQMNDKRSRKIVQLSVDGDVICIYPSVHEMNRCTGYDRSAVSKSANGDSRYSTAYGYKWKYAE